MVVTLDHSEWVFAMDEGRRSKMWNSSGCLCVYLTLWKHRDVSLIELLHICDSTICAAESIILRETGRSWDSAGTIRPLRVTGQAIAAATVCFSLLKYKLKRSFLVYLKRTVFTLAIIRMLLLLLCLWKWHFRSWECFGLVSWRLFWQCAAALLWL